MHFTLLTYILKTNTLVPKDTCIPLFIAALFTLVKISKQPNSPSTNKWIKKMWCIYTMEYYSVIKRMKLCHF